jgi:hypothetical protein
MRHWIRFQCFVLSLGKSDRKTSPIHRKTVSKRSNNSPSQPITRIAGREILTFERIGRQAERQLKVRLHFTRSYDDSSAIIIGFHRSTAVVQLPTSGCATQEGKSTISFRLPNRYSINCEYPTKELVEWWEVCDGVRNVKIKSVLSRVGQTIDSIWRRKYTCSALLLFHLPFERALSNRHLHTHLNTVTTAEQRLHSRMLSFHSPWYVSICGWSSRLSPPRNRSHHHHALRLRLDKCQTDNSLAFHSVPKLPNKQEKAVK